MGSALLQTSRYSQRLYLFIAAQSLFTMDISSCNQIELHTLSVLRCLCNLLLWMVGSHPPFAFLILQQKKGIYFTRARQTKIEKFTQMMIDLSMVVGNRFSGLDGINVREHCLSAETGKINTIPQSISVEGIKGSCLVVSNGFIFLSRLSQLVCC